MYSINDIKKMVSQTTIENWERGGAKSNYCFTNVGQFFRTTIIKRRNQVASLAYEMRDEINNYMVDLGEEKITFNDYLHRNEIDGIIMLHKGKIIFEKYLRMNENDKHITWSVSKVIVSTIIALLEERSLVDIEDCIENYIPELEDTEWQGIKVMDILDMSSGMDCEENFKAYNDPLSNVFKFEASLGISKKNSDMPVCVHQEDTYQYIQSVKKLKEPGITFEYCSVNTQILGWMIEKITGYSVNEVISNEIWSKIGAENDATMIVNNRCVPMVHSGISTTLRDLARFGLLFTESSHKVCDEKLISDKHLSRIKYDGREAIFNNGLYKKLLPEVKHNIHQWDFVFDDNDFFKSGFSNQGLYISPDRDIVIAYFGTLDTKTADEYLKISQLRVFRKMLETLL